MAETDEVTEWGVRLPLGDHKQASLLEARAAARESREVGARVITRQRRANGSTSEWVRRGGENRA